mmetsp:Transcript_19133/g.32026  ORF Transcript_19133/g.32026 Transcript_19133/m.32026 type:complete len:120 (-) Transcript_19133:59-418(-)
MRLVEQELLVFVEEARLAVVAAAVGEGGVVVALAAEVPASKRHPSPPWHPQWPQPLPLPSLWLLPPLPRSQPELQPPSPLVPPPQPLSQPELQSLSPLVPPPLPLSQLELQPPSPLAPP